MSHRVRHAVALAGLALVAVALARAIGDLPPFGEQVAEYGRRLARSAVGDRGANNSVIVTAFDYRALDTLVEELILFVAAVGVALLLRGTREDDEHEAAERVARSEETTTSESLRWVGTGLVGPVALLGVYVVTHGHLSPGGGFQGGVILLGAVLLPLLAGRWVMVTHLRGSKGVEAAEALGAAGFVLVGLGGLLASGAFLQSFLGNGTPGLLASGGTILPLNVTVGIEVAGALLVIATELADVRFLERRTSRR